jgi:CDP-diglyceride synthetase
MLVGLALFGSLPLAIELNGLLPGWSFIPDDLRNVIFFLTIALVFGIVSETGPFRVGRAEALEGVLFFGLFMLVGLMVIYERGWWLGLWTVLPPLLFFLSQISAFQLGRWIGRTPHRKMSNPAETR